jgi:hypothetical protein
LKYTLAQNAGAERMTHISPKRIGNSLALRSHESVGIPAQGTRSGRIVGLTGS